MTTLMTIMVIYFFLFYVYNFSEHVLRVLEITSSQMLKHRGPRLWRTNQFTVMQVRQRAAQGALFLSPARSSVLILMIVVVVVVIAKVS